MKLSDGFNTRRLRLRTPKSWLTRLGTVLAVLFIIFAIIIFLAGATSLLSQPAALHTLNETPAAALVTALTGLILFCIGLFIWTRCRRRLRQSSGLSLAPHLRKRRD